MLKEKHKCLGNGYYKNNKNKCNKIGLRPGEEYNKEKKNKKQKCRTSECIRNQKGAKEKLKRKIGKGPTKKRNFKDKEKTLIKNECKKFGTFYRYVGFKWL